MRRSFRVREYFWGRVVHAPKPLKIWWAVTVSNRRPSRCKLRVPTQICGFSRRIPVYFPNIDPFCFACVPPYGTLVHRGPMGDCTLHTGPSKRAKGAPDA